MQGIGTTHSDEEAGQDGGIEGSYGWTRYGIH